MEPISDEPVLFIPSKVKSDNPPLVNWDKNEHISALAYTFQCEPKLLLPHELENALINTYECLNGMDMLQPLSNTLELLENIDKKHYINLYSQYKIFIRNPWFCKLTVLSALKFYRLLFTSSSEERLAKKAILQQAIATFRPARSESIHLLQLIAKLSEYLDFELDANLIAFVRIVAYSPLNNFKQLAEVISKNAIRRTKASQLKEVLDVEFLPLKGIATSNLELFLLNSSPQMVTRIIEMFSNNIENREGSFLYRILLKVKVKDDFDIWKQTVWPQFYKKFQVIDYDGEFFQSLLKYWIPITVMTYKMKLYQFVCGTPHIPLLLKGHVLLETRRRSLLKSFQTQDVLLLEKLFLHEDTRKLAFQVVGCHSKKGAVLSLTEAVFVSQFLFEQGNAWSRQEALGFNQFLIQISNAVADLYLEEEYLVRLRIILITMLRHGISLLKTSRRHLGAQILMAYYNSFIKNDNWVALQIKLGDDLFQLFEHIRSENFMKLIEEAVLESSEFCSELMDLAIETIEAPKVITNDFLMHFINECCNTLSIKVSDSVKNISRFIALANAKRSQHDNILMLHNRICKDLMALFVSKWSIDVNPTIIFKVTLLFEALNQINRHVPDDVSKREFLNRICSVCSPSVTMMMHREYYQSNNLPDVPAQWLSAMNKMEKIVEALYNSLCEYLLNNTTAISDENKVKLMNILIEVIEHSSMRRPTVLSADLLRTLLISIDGQVEGEYIDGGWKCQNLANYKVDLLNETLDKLNNRVAVMQTLTIRKNPETRLILHAISMSDSSPQKYCLMWILNHLLQILSDKNSKDATTAAALHSTEILMSDRTLYNYTLQFTPELIIKTIHHFENRNWIVRNATMQLAKALIDRFLGVLIGRNNRPKSIDVLFHLFPQLVAPFYEIVTNECLTDSALAVMQFFYESQLKNEPFFTEITVMTKNIFAQSFVVLIKQNSSFYGIFAVRAYVSLCLNRDIPYVVEDVVEFIVEKFEFVRRKHTVRNFLFLLQELYDKYLDYVAEKPIKPFGFYRIHESFAQLSRFLRQFNKKQFDFLLVKVDALEDVVATLKGTDFILSDVYHRLWLHNNLPFLLINTPPGNLTVILSEILSKNIPDFLQVKILSIIVDRLTKECTLYNEIAGITIILCRKAFSIEDSKQNLLMCYYKVILLLYEGYLFINLANETSLLIQLRQTYDPPLNSYKTFICLLILAQVKMKSQNDKSFIKRAVKHFQNSNLLDEDLTDHISETLKYLYKNCECLCDKRRILKLALLLLVEHGRWHFLTFVVGSNIFSPIRAMQKILDFRFLSNFFDSDVMAFEFVKDFYSSISSAKRPAEERGETFYVEEDGAFVDLDSIGLAVIKFVYEFCRHNHMDKRYIGYWKGLNVNK